MSKHSVENFKDENFINFSIEYVKRAATDYLLIKDALCRMAEGTYVIKSNETLDEVKATYEQDIQDIRAIFTSDDYATVFGNNGSKTLKELDDYFPEWRTNILPKLRKKKEAQL